MLQKYQTLNNYNVPSITFQEGISNYSSDDKKSSSDILIFDIFMILGFTSDLLLNMSKQTLNDKTNGEIRVS